MCLIRFFILSNLIPIIKVRVLFFLPVDFHVGDQLQEKADRETQEKENVLE